MKIYNKYNPEDVLHLIDASVESNGSKTMTVPNQSYSIRELLIRSQNGTFPDITFHEEGDYDGPQDPGELDKDFPESEEAIDISDAKQQLDAAPKRKRTNKS